MSLEATPTPIQGADEREKAEYLSKHVRPPCEIPGYDAEKFLGRGAFGEVWVAVDRNTGGRVAIKFFSQRGGYYWSLLTREIEKLRLLSSDRYIVQLIEVGWEAKPPYYVMEYVDQGSLGDRLADGPMPIHEALPLFREIVVGLSHAHNKGILHCDLKPANVLLDQDGRPRLADFGQARLPDEDAPALGTWFYMAPEQADLKASPDARWDVYALGAILYCMLTGSAPYRTRNEEAAVSIEKGNKLEERLQRYREYVAKASRPSAHHAVPGMDRSLRYIIDRCLARDPHKRFPNVQSVLDALDARALSRARRPLLVLGVLAPVLLFLIGGWYLNKMILDASATARDGIIKDSQASNKMAAKLAARQVASGVGQRMSMLRSEAHQDKLREFLTGVRDRGADNSEVWSYLASRRKRFDWMKAPGTWFVQDGAGHIAGVANDDPKDIVPDKALRERIATRNAQGVFKQADYFHGGNATLHDGTTAKPTRHPHISRIRKNAVSKMKELLVIFSEPVWDKSHSEPVGVLCMAVPLGAFLELETGDTDRSITLLRICDEEERLQEGDIRNNGLVLQHSYLAKQFEDKLPTPDAVRVSDETLLAHLRGLQSGKEHFRPESERYHHYRDPFAAETDGANHEDTWLIAPEPVVISARTVGIPDINDPGWIVLAQQRSGIVIDDLEGPTGLKATLRREALMMFLSIIVVLVALWLFVAIALNDSPRSRLAGFLRRRAGVGRNSLISGTSAPKTMETPTRASSIGEMTVLQKPEEMERD